MKKVDHVFKNINQAIEKLLNKYLKMLRKHLNNIDHVLKKCQTYIWNNVIEEFENIKLCIEKNVDHVFKNVNLISEKCQLRI